jgi:hypothetical protein
MTTPIDADQLLRSANPVDVGGLVEPSESVAAQRLFERITGVAYLPAPAQAHRHRWRRSRLYLASAVAAVSVGGGVAYAMIYRQPAKRLDVACYLQARLAGSVSVVAWESGDPVAVCRAAWAAGRVGPGEPPNDLVACVLASGSAAVFPAAGPTDDVCGRLGLARVGAHSPPVNHSVVAVAGMRDRVVAAMSASCLSASQAQAVVHDELRRAGLDWSVTITSPFTPARPCASPGFDEPGRTVMIIPTTPR